MSCRRNVLPLILCLAGAAGCKKKEIMVYRVAKAPPAEASDAGLSAAPRPQSSLRWDLPKGWKELPASGMRLASFAIAGKSREQADISVVVLPGDAGGALSNVNRWRGQIGLEPVGEEQLARASETVRSAAGESRLYEFAKGGKRVLGSILSADGNSWFFKVLGEDAVVASAKPAFKRFLGSLRPNG